MPSIFSLHPKQIHLLNEIYIKGMIITEVVSKVQSISNDIYQFKMQSHQPLTIPSEFTTVSLLQGSQCSILWKKQAEFWPNQFISVHCYPVFLLGKTLVKNKCNTICAMIDLACVCLFRAPPTRIIYTQVRKEWSQQLLSRKANSCNFKETFMILFLPYLDMKYSMFPLSWKKRW